MSEIGLRDRLQTFHQEVLEPAISHNDFPLSIDSETAEDIAEFFNTFLYDSWEEDEE